jgi:hypothetical protein
MRDHPARTDVALAAWTTAFGRLEAQLFSHDPRESDRLAQRYARRFVAPAVPPKRAPRWSPRGLSALA